MQPCFLGLFYFGSDKLGMRRLKNPTAVVLASMGAQREVRSAVHGPYSATIADFALRIQPPGNSYLPTRPHETRDPVLD